LLVTPTILVLLPEKSLLDEDVDVRRRGVRELPLKQRDRVRVLLAAEAVR